MSMLASSASDAFNLVKSWFSQNVGDVGITIIVCLLAMTALLLFRNLIKAAVGKTKIVIKWGQLFLLIITVVLIVILCLMY